MHWLWCNLLFNLGLLELFFFYKLVSALGFCGIILCTLVLIGYINNEQAPSTWLTCCYDNRTVGEKWVTWYTVDPDPNVSRLLIYSIPVSPFVPDTLHGIHQKSCNDGKCVLMRTPRLFIAWLMVECVFVSIRPKRRRRRWTTHHGESWSLQTRSRQRKRRRRRAMRRNQTKPDSSHQQTGIWHANSFRKLQ